MPPIPSTTFFAKPTPDPSKIAYSQLDTRSYLSKLRHLAAGYELREACRKLNGCETGEAKITSGFQLKAKWIVHTVGPIWKGGFENERELLQNCYKNSLHLAQEYKISSVAFPSISTGIYGFPIEEAAKIAVGEVSRLLKKTLDCRVTFACFSDEDFLVYERTLATAEIVKSIITITRRG